MERHFVLNFLQNDLKDWSRIVNWMTGRNNGPNLKPISSDQSEKLEAQSIRSLQDSLTKANETVTAIWWQICEIESKSNGNCKIWRHICKQLCHREKSQVRIWGKGRSSAVGTLLLRRCRTLFAFSTLLTLAIWAIDLWSDLIPARSTQSLVKQRSVVMLRTFSFQFGPFKNKMLMIKPFFVQGKICRIIFGGCRARCRVTFLPLRRI